MDKQTNEKRKRKKSLSRKKKNPFISILSLSFNMFFVCILHFIIGFKWKYSSNFSTVYMNLTMKGNWYINIFFIEIRTCVIRICRIRCKNFYFFYVFLIAFNNYFYSMCSHSTSSFLKHTKVSKNIRFYN